MKIIAKIEVEKIAKGRCYTFRTEPIEVEVVRVHRWRADSTRERYYYMANVVRPAQMHPEAPFAKDSVVQVRICRKLNPRWKPPVFPKGQDAVVIREDVPIIRNICVMDESCGSFLGRSDDAFLSVSREGRPGLTIIQHPPSDPAPACEKCGKGAGAEMVFERKDVDG